MSPTNAPTESPTLLPTVGPTVAPTMFPTNHPTFRPSPHPSDFPTKPPIPSGIGGPADWSYCTSANKCSQGEGDCDSDSHCASGLICGTDNCIEFNSNAVVSADCCRLKPGI